MKMRVIELGLALLLLRCAPLMTMQPPMVPGQDNEIGLGAGVSQVMNGACTGCMPLAQLYNTGLTGQFWYRHRFDNGFRLGAVVSAGNAYAYSGGLRMGWDFYSSESFQLGVDGECGWYWCGGGLPLAYRIGGEDGLWIYGGPYASVTYGGGSITEPILRLPLGFAIPFANNRAMFVGEVSAVYRPMFVSRTYARHILLVVGGVGLVARM
jgi:hypothetical protein